MAAMAVAAAALLTGACGEAPDVVREPWPLAVGQPGVVGYAATSALPATAVREVAADVLGWEPDGLATSAPAALVHLDPTTFGGRVALVLAVDDGEAFLRSLEDCPSVEPLGDGEFGALLRQESEIVRGLKAVDAMLSAGSRADQIMAALAAMAETGPQVVEFHAFAEDGLALIAPSFEARGVTAAFARRVAGLREPAAASAAGGNPATGRAPADGLVVSIDVARARVVYHEQIKQAVDSLRALVVGAQGAGLGMALSEAFGRDGDRRGDRDGDQPPEFAFPAVSWDTVQALMEMADADALRAVQLRLAVEPEQIARAREGTELPPVDGFVLRFDHDPDSAVGRVVTSAAPAPHVPEALAVARAEPDAFARALAGFMRPLAESERGRGAPAEQAAAELERLLLPWSGVVTVLPHGDDGGLVAAPLRDPAAADPAALLAWFEPLLDGFGLSLEGRLEQTPDGRWQGLDDDGRAVLTAGLHDDVLWIGPGDVADPPRRLLESVSAAIRGPMPASGPSLVLADDLVRILVDSAGDGTWQLDMTWEPERLER